MLNLEDIEMKKEWKNAEIMDLEVVATAQNPPVPFMFDGVLNADGSEQSGLGKASGAEETIKVQVLEQ